MKVLFVWTGVTSYMADCWRALQAQPGVELKVVVERVRSGRLFAASALLEGLDATLVEEGAVPPLGDYRPDVLFAVGWHSRVVRAFVCRADWEAVPKVCCMDMPWRWLPRCLAARFVLRPYLRRFRAMFVPGRAAFRYARWLGFAAERIVTGLYALDVGRFAAARTATPKAGFLYLGRFSPEKRLDVLLAAYARYRAAGGTWPLDLYGEGEPVPAADGVRVHPFVQPASAAAVLGAARCLVLASDFDPWPLVVLEAAASARPVLVTAACGNAAELVRANGRVVPTGDAAALAAAMLAVERGEVPLDGAAGLALATPYAADAWAEKVVRICAGL